MSSIKNLDIFGEEQRLLFRGNRIHNTMIGLVASLFVYATVATVFIINLIQLFQMENPTATQSVNLVNENDVFKNLIGQVIKLTSSNFFFAISVLAVDEGRSDYNTYLMNNETQQYFRIQALVYGAETTEFVNVIRCTSEVVDKFYIYAPLSVRKDLARYGYCLDTSDFDQKQNLFLNAETAKSEDQYMLLLIFWCEPTILDACSPRKNLSKYSVQISYTDYIVDQQSSEPDQQIIQKTSQLTDSSTFSSTSIKLNKISYTTIQDIFTINPKLETKEFYQRSNEISYQSNIQTGVSSFDWKMESVKTHYVRRYPNILDILAKCSGLYALIVGILGPILRTISRGEMNNWLIHQFFSTSEQTNQQKNEQDQSHVNPFKIIQLLYGKDNEAKRYQQSIYKLDEIISIEYILRCLQKQKLLEQILFDEEYIHIFQNLNPPKWTVLPKPSEQARPTNPNDQQDKMILRLMHLHQNQNKHMDIPQIPSEMDQIMTPNYRTDRDQVKIFPMQ